VSLFEPKYLEVMHSNEPDFGSSLGDCADMTLPKTFESEFSSTLQGTHSLVQGQIERMSPNSGKTPKFKIINDRYI